MRRTGPFYSLLVAFQYQSRLPVAASLVPSVDDQERAHGWLPIVGLGVGAALAALAALLAALSMAPVAAAAVLAVSGLVISGGWFGVGLGRSAECIGARFDPQGSAGAGRVAIPAALASMLVLEFGALVAAGADVGAALLTAQFAARLSTMVATQLPHWKRVKEVASEEPTRWGSAAVASGGGAVVVLLFAGAVGLLAILFAVLAGAGASHLGKSDRRAAEVFASGSGAVALLLALCCFCF